MSQDKKELIKIQVEEAGFSIMSTELKGEIIDTSKGPVVPSSFFSQLEWSTPNEWK